MNKTLKDCCLFQEGYVNPSQKIKEYFGNDIKWLRAVDLNDDEVFETSEKLSKKGFNSAGASAFMFPKNSLAISKSGSIGTLGILRDEMCGNRAVININVQNNADLDYIFYLLKYKRKEVVSKAVGSIQKNLYVSELEKIELCHDDVADQKRVVEVLKTIDNKIRNNNKISYELEELAKTIYDYWFLQFEFPNEEGKPYKSSGGKMVYNEELNREIPDGWEVKKLNDITDQVNGYPFSTDDYLKNGEYKLYTIKNVQGDGIDVKSDAFFNDLPVNMNKECILSPNDLIMSLTGNVGRVGIVFENNVLLNQRVLKLKEKSVSKEFLYLLLRDRSFRKQIEQISTGTSQKNLSPVELGMLNIIVPNCVVMKKFDALVNNFVSTITLRNKENQQLASLRDWLLPMLMNGQVTI